METDCELAICVGAIRHTSEKTSVNFSSQEYLRQIEYLLERGLPPSVGQWVKLMKARNIPLGGRDFQTHSSDCHSPSPR